MIREYIEISNVYLRKFNYFPSIYYKSVIYEGKIKNTKKEIAEKELGKIKNTKFPFCPLIKNGCNSYCINYQKPFINKMTINGELVYFVYKNYCKYFKMSF